MMVSEKLKVGVLTGHIPFKFISKKLSKLELIKKINILMDSLKNNFKINNPKIGILSLNPHAGEDGMLGNEEDKIIKPVIKKLNHKNKNVYGPFSSDSYFGNKLYKKYDATFSLYHDQGLIPFKMISFSDKKWDWRYLINENDEVNESSPALYELLPQGKYIEHKCQINNK